MTRAPIAAALTRHWFVLALAGAVAATLAAPEWFRPATQQLSPRAVISAALFLTAWTMPGRTLAGEVTRPLAALWAALLSFSLVPASAWLLGLLAPTPDVRVGLLLVSSVPCTLTSAVLWTRLAGGNEATALLTVLLTTLTSWLITTAWLAGATGTQVEIPIAALMLDLVLYLLVPVAAGQMIRLAGPAARFAQRHRAALGVLAQLLVVAIVLKASADVGLRLRDSDATLEPFALALAVALPVALHLFALASGLVSSRWLGFDRPRRLAIAFACSQKTLPVSIYLFERYFADAYPLALPTVLAYHVGQLLLDTALAHALRHESSPQHVEAHEPERIPGAQSD